MWFTGRAVKARSQQPSPARAILPRSRERAVDVARHFARAVKEYEKRLEPSVGS
jgi:hypothetical protein